MTDRHLIESLTLECTFTSEAVAWNQQSRISDFIQGLGKRLIAEVFERLSPPGEVWEIDRLEVDLGFLAVSEGDEAWGARLAARIEDHLMGMVGAELPAPGGTALEGWGLQGHVPPVQQRRRARTEHDAEAFLHYLKRGYLPWSRSRPPVGDFSAWIAQAVRQAGPQLWAALQRQRPEAQIVARLAQALPRELIQSLVQGGHPEPTVAIQRVEHFLLAHVSRPDAIAAHLGLPRGSFTPGFTEASPDKRTRGNPLRWVLGQDLPAVQAELALSLTRRARRFQIARTWDEDQLLDLLGLLSVVPSEDGQVTTLEQIRAAHAWVPQQLAAAAQTFEDNRRFIAGAARAEFCWATWLWATTLEWAVCHPGQSLDQDELPAYWQSSLGSLGAERHWLPGGMPRPSQGPEPSPTHIHSWVRAWATRRGEPAPEGEATLLDEFPAIQAELVRWTQDAAWRGLIARTWEQPSLLRLLSWLGSTSFVPASDLVSWLPSALHQQAQLLASGGEDAVPWLWEVTLNWAARHPGQPLKPYTLQSHWARACLVRRSVKPHFAEPQSASSTSDVLTAVCAPDQPGLPRGFPSTRAESRAEASGSSEIFMPQGPLPNGRGSTRAAEGGGSNGEPGSTSPVEMLAPSHTTSLLARLQVQEGAAPVPSRTPAPGPSPQASPPHILAWVRAWATRRGEPAPEGEATLLDEFPAIQAELVRWTQDAAWRGQIARTWTQSGLLRLLSWLGSTSYVPASDPVSWLPSALHQQAQSLASDREDAVPWLWEVTLNWAARHPGQAPEPHTLQSHWERACLVRRSVKPHFAEPPPASSTSDVLPAACDPDQLRLSRGFSSTRAEPRAEASESSEVFMPQGPLPNGRGSTRAAEGGGSNGEPGSTSPVEMLAPSLTASLLSRLQVQESAALVPSRTPAPGPSPQASPLHILAWVRAWAARRGEPAPEGEAKLTDEFPAIQAELVRCTQDAAWRSQIARTWEQPSLLRLLSWLGSTSFVPASDLVSWLPSALHQQAQSLASGGEDAVPWLWEVTLDWAARHPGQPLQPYPLQSHWDRACLVRRPVKPHFAEPQSASSTSDVLPAVCAPDQPGLPRGFPSTRAEPRAEASGSSEVFMPQGPLPNGRGSARAAEGGGSNGEPGSTSLVEMLAPIHTASLLSRLQVQEGAAPVPSRTPAPGLSPLASPPHILAWVRAWAARRGEPAPEGEAKLTDEFPAIQAEVVRWPQDAAWRGLIARTWEQPSLLRLLSWLGSTSFVPASDLVSWLPSALNQQAQSLASGREYAVPWLWEVTLDWAARHPGQAPEPHTLQSHWAQANQQALVAPQPSAPSFASLAQAFSASDFPNALAIPLREFLLNPGIEARLRVAETLDSPEACAAWLTVTTEAQRWEFLGAFLPKDYEILKNCSELLLSAARHALPNQSPEALRQAYWRFLTCHLFEQGFPADPAVLTRRYALFLATLNAPQASSLHEFHTRLAAGLKEMQEAQVPDPALLKTMLQALEQLPSAAEQWEATHFDKQLELEPVPSGPAWSYPDPATGSAADPIWVGNAGLVLLGPYFLRLFSTLGLVSNRAFVDDAARERAVYCLEYLVHGHTRTLEPEWVLDKLICGIPLAQPVPPCSGLELATCESLTGLLESVIGHWTALGKTSLAGLRETFFQREGRLTRKPGDAGEEWTLAVESRTFDMLLDRLPWGISPLTLPWIQGMIHVEWR